MKLVLLLPGYLDSPDYLHFKIFEKTLRQLNYTVEKVDACDLWKTGDVTKYNVTNYLKSIKNIIDFYQSKNPSEIILIGHSLGAMVATIAGNKYSKITKIILLCPPVLFDLFDSKWNKNGLRHSIRDLPNHPLKFREFNIPKSFVSNRKKYDIFTEIRKIKQPLMILIALKDKSISPSESEQLVTQAKHPYVVRIKNLGHNFRFSSKESTQVANEIKKYLSF